MNKSSSGHSWIHPIAESTNEVSTKFQRSTQNFPSTSRLYDDFLVHDNDKQSRVVTGKWPIFSAHLRSAACCNFYH
jgi:hypothetical protein